MKRDIRHIYMIIIVLLSAISCTSPIDIETDQASPRLVIFGAFRQDTIRNYVSISKSMGFFSQSPPITIDNAKVTITANDTVYQLYPDTVAGRYYIDSLNILVGREYILDVYLDFDQNGVDEHYRAKSRMTNTPRIDSVKLSGFVIQKLPIMFVYGKVFYTSDNNFCVYNWKNRDTIGIFNYLMIMPERFLKTTGYAYTVPYFVKDGFSKGDTLHFRIDNFSNEYSRFISQAASASGMQNPFFSSPPSEVKTNIRCLDADIRVSGFFTTYSRGAVFSVISNIDFDFGSIGGMR